MIKKRADAFGCLAIAFIVASFLAFFLLGFSQMGDMQDERLRPPLWQAAALAMALSFGPALAVAIYMTERAHRVAVLVAGLVVALSAYVVIGLLWWFRI